MQMIESKTQPSVWERARARLLLWWCLGLLGTGTLLWTPVARCGGAAGAHGPSRRPCGCARFFAFYLANLRAISGR
jgi:hypothetical protein